MSKNKIISRKLDETGRIVIPKPFREALSIHEGDDVEILMCDGYIALRKPREVCDFCGGYSTMEFKGKRLCAKCIDEITNCHINFSKNKP